MEFEVVRYMVRRALDDALNLELGLATANFAPELRRGYLALLPGGETLKGKALAIEDFWHKITMNRDRVRVMEQKINAVDGDILADYEKAEWQRDLTRLYVGFSAFSALFLAPDAHHGPPRPAAADDPQTQATLKVMERALPSMLMDLLGCRIRPVVERYRQGRFALFLPDSSLTPAVIEERKTEITPWREYPADRFLRPLLIVRDALDRLAARADPEARALPDAVYGDIKGLITRIQGTFTTFNILFADKNDYFVGEKGKGG